VKIGVVAFVLDLHQLFKQGVTAILLPLVEEDMHGLVGFRRTDTVDAGDRGHDDHIPPGEKGAGG